MSSRVCSQLAGVIPKRRGLWRFAPVTSAAPSDPIRARLAARRARRHIRRILCAKKRPTCVRSVEARRRRVSRRHDAGVHGRRGGHVEATQRSPIRSARKPGDGSRGSDSNHRSHTRRAPLFQAWISRAPIFARGTAERVLGRWRRDSHVSAPASRRDTSLIEKREWISVPLRRRRVGSVLANAVRRSTWRATG